MAKVKSNEKLNNGLIDALDLQIGLNDTGDINGLESLYKNVSQRLLSLEPMVLNYAYKTYGLIQTAIDQPIDDAFRGGFDIESSTLSTEEIDKLKNTINENKDLEKIKDTLRWESLFGGGVLIANTDQNPEDELSEKRIEKGNLSFIASDRWECVSQDTSVLAGKSDFVYNGVKVNKSRVKILTGKTAPYYVRMRLQGWGLSELESTLPPLTQYLKSMNVILELLDESKIDILKINGLASTLAQSGGSQKIRQRVDVASKNKNYKSMLTMDAMDSYEQKTLTFAGLSEMAKEIRTQISAYLKIPMSKLWGIGSSGFSSGEDDLENYNSLVEDKRAGAISLLKWVCDLRSLQLFGRKIPDLEFKFKPLRVLNASEEQSITDRKVDNVIKLLNSKVLTIRQGAEKLVKENALNLTEEEIENVPDEYTEIEQFGDMIE